MLSLWLGHGACALGVIERAARRAQVDYPAVRWTAEELGSLRRGPRQIPDFERLVLKTVAFDVRALRISARPSNLQARVTKRRAVVRLAFGSGRPWHGRLE